VKPALPPYQGHFLSDMTPYEFPPHASVVASTYYEHTIFYRSHGWPPEWEDLRSFGYWLMEPGYYRLVAIPRIHGLERTGRGVVDFVSPVAESPKPVTIEIR
jgi:hypothetical protein